MSKWRLKSCPRCGGDLYIENDVDRNWYEQCLQCSHRRKVEDTGDLKEQPIREEKRTPVAGGLKNRE